MNQNKCIAFLDILGFSEYMKSTANQAQESAINMLSSINYLFKSRLTESKVNPWHSYEPALQPLAKRNDICSFESFLPMSDSIFITGYNANDFLDQLSSFMCSCFRYTSKEYNNPMDKTAPERIMEKQYKYDDDKNLVAEEIEVQWYPQIFRGGVSFGEAHILQMTSLMRNKDFMTEAEIKRFECWGLKTGVQQTPNLAGMGVVKAVALENCGGKGPKLYLDEDLINELDDEHKALLKSDTKGTHYLWPAYSLIWENEFNRELFNECYDFLLPAIKLLVAYKGKPHESHYFEFVKLIIHSYIALEKRFGDEKRTKELIVDFLQKHDALYISFDM